MYSSPEEVTYGQITTKKSLSPKNYATVRIQNRTLVNLSEFLDKEKPFDTGIEPGSFAYVNKSIIGFIRNSCIDLSNITQQSSKVLFLNPNYEYSSSLVNEDVLLCKDANIGDACLLILQDNLQVCHSSGVVRLNFINDEYKFYCLAFLRDEFFRKQLDILTPRGSTIRHSGEKFLQCKIPSVTSEIDNLMLLIGNIQKNIAYSEKVSFQKISQINELIKLELQCSGYFYEDPSFSEVESSLRLDSGYHSEVVSRHNFGLQRYKNGCLSLDDFGFTIKRGPNLARRDLGRSLQTDQFKTNYHLLVYPSDISENGYILKSSFIGARNPVWYLKSGDLLFSAEGTVGKTFIVCDVHLKFTTNFHGIIITPKNKQLNLSKSIVLGLYLSYLRSIGIFDKLSVGGQGGSFAVSYWDKILIPDFDESFSVKISSLYYSKSALSPSKFDKDILQNSGVFDLNNFRIECIALLQKVVSDIKNSSIHELSYYENFL